MEKTIISKQAFGVLLLVGVPLAFAAPDWTKVPIRDVSVFHPGVTPIEWVGKKSDHTGMAGLRKGESCIGCHEEKNKLNFSFKRLADKELEPVGAPEMMTYPVGVQAAYDASNLYIRLTFKSHEGAADKGDKENEVKVSVMFPDAKVPQAEQVGCWAACHIDARTMPGADDKKTKYAKEGTYELMQWKSAKGARVVNGLVTSERKMDGGTLAAKAEGAKVGGTYIVTFTRKNPGEGKTIPFGFAIHGDHATGRFHHVSLGYILGVGAVGDVNAVKQ